MKLHIAHELPNQEEQARARARARAMNMCPLCVPFGIHSSLFASLLTLLKNCVLFSIVSEQSEGWSNVNVASPQGLNSK